jgi:NAD(P)-dependent dehydrogenase (short-subunit alcohol dehydrogenase family)
VTATFAPILIKSSNPRLLFITSGLSTLEGASKGLLPNVAANGPAGWPKKGLLTGIAYRASKAGLNMVMLIWNSLLKEDGVKTWCISPGFVNTGLGGMPDKVKKERAGDPATSGDFIKRVLEGERDEDVGKVVHVGGGVQAW